MIRFMLSVVTPQFWRHPVTTKNDYHQLIPIPFSNRALPTPKVGRQAHTIVLPVELCVPDPDNGASSAQKDLGGSEGDDDGVDRSERRFQAGQVVVVVIRADDRPARPRKSGESIAADRQIDQLDLLVGDRTELPS